MITGFFLSVLFSVCQFIIDHLPIIQYPTQITDAINWFWGAVNLFSMVTPVSTLALIVGLTALADGAYLAWVFFHWLLRRFRH